MEWRRKSQRILLIPPTPPTALVSNNTDALKGTQDSEKSLCYLRDVVAFHWTIVFTKLTTLQHGWYSARIPLTACLVFAPPPTLCQIKNNLNAMSRHPRQRMRLGFRARRRHRCQRCCNCIPEKKGQSSKGKEARKRLRRWCCWCCCGRGRSSIN